MMKPEAAWQIAWQMVIEQLRRDVPRASFEKYVRDTRLIAFEDGIFAIAGKDEFTCAWLTARLTRTVVRMLEGMLDRPVEVEFKVQVKE
jgi:chromosomal replication initiation ATPase DnaA